MTGGLKDALAAIVQSCLDERYIEHDEDVQWVAERLASAFQKLTAEQFEGEPVYLFIGDAS